ncbi:Ig-like domain-containing protein [Lentilactobacillus buchneri]|uniref:Ig-like domain-containing protein n=1 Tax=Lentilactobacillus buchneri TaxID=1581 RepID=UPI001290E20A|nr:Ig-like domain-containing protein [Lentilactobacillus buchneri]MQM59507.1 hypothetical protein [Lentilactobacillus buchneri]
MKIGRLLIVAAVSLTTGMAIMSQPALNKPSYAAERRIHGVKVMKPKLKFKYSTINQGEKFDPYKGGYYYYDKPDKVYMTAKSYVDTSQPGKYFVIYHVKDRAGYNFKVKHVVTVRAVYLTGIYNPNHNADDSYDVSNVGDDLKLVPRYNVKTTNSDVTWESSNPAVMSVSENGEATANSDGVAVITAKLNGKSIQTPVLVTESSHLTFGNSDDLLSIAFDDSYIAYKMKTDLHQYPYGVWITNGEVFGYSDEIDDESTNPDHRDEISPENGGIFTPDVGGNFKIGDGDSIVLITKDELGQQHQYVGSYKFME